MAITVKTRTIVIGIILSLFLTFFGGWYYGYIREKKASQIAQESLKTEIQKLSVQINDTEYQLTKTEQELITERQLRKQDIIDKETLRAINVKHVTEISKLKFRIDTLLEDVNHNGNIIIVRDTVVTQLSQKAILLPFSFAKKDKWLDLKGMFDDNGKLGVDLKMDMEVDVITGTAKSGERTVNILTDNTYIGVIGVRSYKTDVEKPKRWGIGPSLGYAVCRNGLSPFVGVSVSYSLIQF